LLLRRGPVSPATLGRTRDPSRDLRSCTVATQEMPLSRGWSIDNRNTRRIGGGRLN